METLIGLFAFVFLFVLAFGLYFLPSFIAIARSKRNTGAIVVLNICLGWSFIGWVVALVWALTADEPLVAVYVPPQYPYQPTYPQQPMYPLQSPYPPQPPYAPRTYPSQPPPPPQPQQHREDGPAPPPPPPAS